MKIVFAESAVRALDDILSFYAGRDVAEVRGRVVPEFEAPYLRELIHAPFRSVYRRESRRVSVVRVWRGERPLSLASGDAGVE